MEVPEESIANMQVQTQHSTWFRDAKYQSLGSLLPELFDATGALDMKALKEFQGNDLYNKLTAENRALIDDLIADWELYEDALTEVKDYLTGYLRRPGQHADRRPGRFVRQRHRRRRGLQTERGHGIAAARPSR